MSIVRKAKLGIDSVTKKLKWWDERSGRWHDVKLDNGGSHPVAGSVTTPLPVGKSPYSLAVTPDGSTLWVADADETSPGLVTVIDLLTGAITTVEVGDNCFALVITPDGAKCYAGGSDIRPIDVSSMIVGSPIDALLTDGMVVTPDGATVYAVDEATSVVPITVATDTPGTPIVCGSGPEAVCITPDGSKLYVCNSDNTVTPVDVASGTPGSALTFADAAIYTCGVTPDGQTAYFGLGSNGTIVPVDVATDALGTPITIPDGVGSFLAITPDGTTIFVAAAGGTGAVTPVDVATGTPGTPITVVIGSVTVNGLALSPDGATLYCAIVGAAQAGTVVAVDVATQMLTGFAVALSAVAVGGLAVVEGMPDPTGTEMSPSPSPGSLYMRKTGELWLRTGTSTGDWSQMATL